MQEKTLPRTIFIYLSILVNHRNELTKETYIQEGSEGMGLGTAVTQGPKRGHTHPSSSGSAPRGNREHWEYVCRELGKAEQLKQS